MYERESFESFGFTEKKGESGKQAGRFKCDYRERENRKYMSQNQKKEREKDQKKETKN